MRGIYEKVKGSGIWWVCYFDADGRRRREKVGSKKAALKLYTKRRAQALEGRKLPDNLRKKAITFGELTKDMLAFSRAHHAQPRGDESRIRLLLGAFADRVADSIAPQEIDQQLAEWAQARNWTPSTINRFKAAMSLCYSLAIKNGKLTANPVRLVPHRREDNSRVRFVTEEEENQFHVNLKPRQWLEFTIAVNTGLRLSEQYSLARPHVDLDRKLVTVARSKNGQARHIPLNAPALTALEWILASHSNVQVFPFARHAQGGHSPRWFRDAVERLKIPDLHWHDLRHTFASRLVMAGVDIRTVQELLGHKSIMMTMRYAHLAPDHQRAAVEKLEPRPGTRQPSATTTATAPKGAIVSIQ